MNAPDIRSQRLDPLAFPLHGSRLIEASAGTGKTFTIAFLYLRLVLAHGAAGERFGRPLAPPEILVVTFTEAATQELKERIRARLSEAARCFASGDESADPLLRALRDSYDPSRWPGCARTLQLAAEWMDEAAVSTIHGWCYRMLREHAFDSGSLFAQELEADEQQLREEVVRDYWRRHFYALSPGAAHAVAQCFSGPEALGRALDPMLRQQGASFVYGGAPAEAPADLHGLLEDAGAWYAECDALHEAARQAWAAAADELRTLWHGLRPHLNANSYRNKDDDAVFTGWLDALAAWSDGGDPPGNIARFGQTGIKLKGGKAVPEHAAFAAIDDWCARRDTPPELGPAILLHALREVGAELERRKQQRARIGFDDLLRRLDRALQGPGGARLAAVIRRQFPVALIDEFQDTDPVQYRIFDAIYGVAEAGEDRGLFLIGDPKQAIYAFRGADIHTYLEARAATAGRHYTLGTNFRSTRAMVDAVNRCFAHADTHGRGAFRFRADDDNPVPFEAVDARGRAEILELDGAPAPALTFWQLPPDEDGEVVTSGRYRERMAEHAATAVRDWLAAAAGGRSGFRGPDGFAPLQPADIAVLVRNRTEAQAIRDALARRGLPSVYLSDKDSVFASPEARDLLAWLRACAEPASDVLLRRALATRSMGLDWAALDRLNHDEAYWEAQALRFRDYHHCWQAQGVLPMLRRMLADFDVPARLLRLPDGERALTNLLHLAEWLQRTSAEVDGEHALIRALADRIDQPGGEEVLRLESDAELVKVVTIHKSKGLEYPLVLLPFVCSWREVASRADSPPPSFHGAEGRVMELLRDKKQGGDAVAEAYARAEDERLSEDMRLLYVALTRARHATWLGIAPLVSGAAKQNELHKSAVGYLLGGDAPQTREEIAGRVAALTDGVGVVAGEPPEIVFQRLDLGGDIPLAPARVPRRSVREAWWIASYSSLPVADAALVSSAPPPVPEPESAVEATFLEERETADDGGWGGEGIHSFPRGAEAGTFLHGLLEWAGQGGFAGAATDAAARRDAIARRANLRGWTDRIDTLDVWLQDLLARPLPLPDGERFTLADLTLADYRVEMEFWFASHRVDLIALDALVTRHTLDGRPRPALAPRTLNGMFKGFIDLTFQHEGRYYVCDYKSNWLGETGAAYTPPRMRDAVLAARYELQYVIYLLALHRHLKARLGDEYDYDEHVGGAFCVFLRGTGTPGRGVHLERPPAALIEALDAMFSGGRE